MKLLLIFFSGMVLMGCSNPKNSANHLANKGVVTVLNGRDEIDSLKYSCDSCAEILKFKSIFDTIISIASKEAKENLRNKLSFKPRTADITVWRADSLYYTTGKRIDNLIVVLAKYKCIGKNGYGVEDEVESSSLIYLVHDEVVDLEGKIRKDSLYLTGNLVSRTLSLSDEDGRMNIQPMISRGKVHLIVTTDESCVENARLRFEFTDGSNFSSTSWNDFNCKGTSYFELTEKDIDLLSKIPLSLVSFTEDNHLFCSVPENERDYFTQFMRLIKK